MDRPDEAARDGNITLSQSAQNTIQRHVRSYLTGNITAEEAMARISHVIVVERPKE